MRKQAFALMQKFKKGNVIKYIEELERDYNTIDNRRKEIQEKRLENLIEHVVRSVPYYSKYKQAKTIRDFPIISKKEIKENFNSFLSTDFDKENLIPLTTSGSYGTPFTFYITKEKKERQHAEVIYFSRWGSYDIGVRHGYVVAKTKSKLTQYLQNQTYITPFNITEEWLEEQVLEIRRKRLEVLIGYASAIGAIAKYMNHNNITYNMKGVITISEVLTEEARQDIRKAFNTNPISRYSTEELGVLSIECPECNNQHLNDLNYVIEILKMEEDVPAEAGEVGRIVVTDLFSHAMPLIRYEIGDLAIKGEGACSCGRKSPFLKSLLGRQLEEIYNTNKDPVISMALNGKMRDIENVLQFQLIQVGEIEYHINLVTMEGFSDEDEVINRYTSILGEDAIIIINYLEDIPPLKSGKRPYILQRYYKK